MDWACHKNAWCAATKVFYGALQVGKRSQGGQKKRYKDTLKASPNDFNIPPEFWEQIPLDRAKWRCLIRKGADEYEANRLCEAERKRKERKARAKGSSSESSLLYFATDSLEQTSTHEHLITKD